MAWLRNKKQADITDLQIKAAATRPGGGIIRGPGIGYNAEWDVDRIVKDALEKVVWVFRCVEAVSSNAARVPLVVRKNNAYDGNPVAKHPLYNIFNSRSNPGETSYVFRFRLSAQLLLSKKGVFVELTRNKANDVIAMTILPAQYVTIVPDPEDFIKAYEFNMTVLDSTGRLRDVQKTIPAEDMLWIRKPHPFDPYKAMTVMDSAGLSIETDWYARMYNRNFLMNDGRPGGMVVIKGDTSDEDEQELKSRFRGGVGGAGRITVITSEQGADFVDTAVTPRDAQYIDSRKITKEEILLGFGVPETVLASAAGRTLDNAEIERLVFWQETMLPHLELITREFDILDEDPNAYVGVDLDRIDVLQRMDMKRKEYALRELDAGATSVDEYRLDTGRKALPNDAGAVLFRQKTKIPYATTTGDGIPDMPEVMNGPLPTPSANPEGNQRTTPVQDSGDDEPRVMDDNGDRNAPMPTAKAFEITDDFTKLVVKQTEMSYDHWNTIVSQLLKRYFDRQKRVVSEKISGQKMRKLMEHRQKAIADGGNGPSTNPALQLKTAVESVFDQSMWDSQLTEDLRPVLEDIAKEFGEGVDADFDVESVSMKHALDKQMQRVVKINTTTKDLIGQVITAALLSDMSVETLSQSVSDTFDETVPDRIEKIATTEITAAAMGAKYVAASTQQGLSKTWVTTGDNHVRQTHQEAEGQEVGINDVFQVGGSTLMYPCDPDGSAEEVINCRCAMVLSSETTA